jgi:UDP-GlcNAc:undecaprenyl-phosphate GlcNAc-1-phosphate transferase
MSKEDYIIICASLIIATAIAFFITPLVIRYAKKAGIVDTPSDGRRMHNHPIPLLGGISIILGFFVTAFGMSLLLHQVYGNSQLFHRLLQILPGAAIIAVMGYFDDKYDLPALPRLLVQCVAAGITVAMGVQITLISGSVRLFHAQTFYLGMLSVPVTIIWIVGITNAVNWIDGLDGLAAGIASIASFSMLLIAVFQPQNQALSIAVLAAALAGGCFGLLPYNKNPAKIFMGDTGAMFLGFTLSVVSIQGLFKIYAAVSFVAPLLILGLPGKSPATPDRSHIHHKLVDMGLSQKQAVILLYSSSSVLGLVAVLFSIFKNTVGWRFLIAGLAVVIVLFIAMLLIFRRWNHRVALGTAACKETQKPDTEAPSTEAGEDATSAGGPITKP